MKNGNPIRLFAVALTLWAPVAMAQDQAADAIVERLDKDGPVSLDELSEAQNTVARLNLLLEIEKKRAEIEQARKSRDGGFAAMATAPLPMPGGAPSMFNDPSGMGAGASQSSGPESYSVSRLFGANGAYSAILISDTGKSVIAKTGDTLPNGAQIQSVSLGGVRISDNYGEYSLPFMSDAGTSSGAPSNAMNGQFGR